MIRSVMVKAGLSLLGLLLLHYALGLQLSDMSEGDVAHLVFKEKWDFNVVGERYVVLQDLNVVDVNDVNTEIRYIEIDVNVVDVGTQHMVKGDEWNIEDDFIRKVVFADENLDNNTVTLSLDLPEEYCYVLEYHNESSDTCVYPTWTEVLVNQDDRNGVRVVQYNSDGEATGVDYNIEFGECSGGHVEVKIVRNGVVFWDVVSFGEWYDVSDYFVRGVKALGCSNGVIRAMTSDENGTYYYEAYAYSVSPPEEGGEEGPVCGNGVCEEGENYETCPQDCPAPEQPKTKIEEINTGCWVLYTNGVKLFASGYYEENGEPKCRTVLMKETETDYQDLGLGEKFEKYGVAVVLVQASPEKCVYVVSSMEEIEVEEQSCTSETLTWEDYNSLKEAYKKMMDKYSVCANEKNKLEMEISTLKSQLEICRADINTQIMRTQECMSERKNWEQKYSECMDSKRVELSEAQDKFIETLNSVRQDLNRTKMELEKTKEERDVAVMLVVVLAGLFLLFLIGLQLRGQGVI